MYSSLRFAHSLGIKALNALGISVTAYRSQINALRDIHKGKRAFVIGNGPSLRMEDLDALKNEITFASNKIYLAYPNTSFRPSVYAIGDPLIAQAADLTEVGGTTKEIYSQTVFPWLSKRDAIFLPESHVPLHLRNRAAFSTDLRTGAYAGWTVTVFLLQLAYWMGIETVYLLGVDHSYAGAGDKPKPGELYASGGETNHFSSLYYKRGEKWRVPNMSRMEDAYLAANVAYEDSGRSVFNASRSSQLSIFPRVRLEDVL